MIQWLVAADVSPRTSTQISADSRRRLRTLLLLLSFIPGALMLSADDGTDKFIKAEMERRQIPGLSLAVVHAGKLLKAQGYGLANIELGVPVTTNTVFEIGSITKQFTAGLILMLAQDGKMALDDPLSKHLRDLPESWSGITLRHLLTHTSGLRNYTGLDGFEVRARLNCQSFVRTLQSHPLESKPGESFAYCNSGYNLLGYVIGQSTGKSYWDFLRARILDPLRMTTTQSRDLQTVITNRADGYELKNGMLVNRDSDLTDVFAAGAMVSTVIDLVKWNTALDSEKLLSRESQDAMWTATKLNAGTNYLYGLGWRLEPHNGRPNIGHSGSTSGFSASLQRFPQDKLAVIVLCNLGEQGLATKVARSVADLYLKAEVGGD